MSQRGCFVTLKHIFIHTTVLVHQGKTPQINLHLPFSILFINFGIETIHEKLKNKKFVNFRKFSRYTYEDRVSETRRSSFFACRKTQTHHGCELLLAVEIGRVDSYTAFSSSIGLTQRNAL